MNNAQLLPLMMFGGSMLSQAGPQPYPQSFGSALGGALNAGVQGMLMGQQMDERGRSNKLQELSLIQQMNEMQRAAAQQMKRDQALQNAMKGMSPEDQALAQADPNAYFAAATKARFDKPNPKDRFMTAGGGIFDISGEKPLMVGQGPPTEKTTNNISVMPPDVNIDVGGKKQFEAVQGYYGDLFANSQKQALAAPATLAKMRRLDDLLSQIDTGKFAPAAAEFKSTLKGLGIDPEALGLSDNVGAAQAAQALSREMALQLRSPEGGAGMPGALSDQDRSFLESMVPSLSMTKEGRKYILGFQEKMLGRQQQVAQMAREYAQQNGWIDSKFIDQLQEFSKQNPIAPPVVTPEQAAQLAPGTEYVGTDGVVRRR